MQRASCGQYQVITSGCTRSLIIERGGFYIPLSNLVAVGEQGEVCPHRGMGIKGKNQGENEKEWDGKGNVEGRKTNIKREAIKCNLLHIEKDI